MDRIRLAVTRDERVLVYGDYDVDGVTGSAILHPVLIKIGAKADVHIPHRVTEGYGLNRESLKRLVDEKNYKLVITVDNGITGVSQIEYLVSRGVDVIVVDHHLPKDKMPPAVAIVSSCAGDQGDSNLAACGLAFKVGCALLGFEAMEEFLDLVVVGTICDIATVQGDNRTLLKFGLPKLAKTQRPGLRALMDVARVSRGQVSYRDIAFGIGPRINAAGRMGSALDAFTLLTTRDAEQARALAALLDNGNRQRQKAEADAFGEASEKWEAMDRLSDPVIVVESPDWHEGVLGIVAARMVERFHRPAIVISMKNGLGKGSGRSVPAFSLFDCVSTVESHLEAFGGHAQACGLSIRSENVNIFREKLNESALKAEGLGQVDLEIDAELPFEQIDTQFLKDLEKLAPFGPGNKKPLFISKGLKLRGEPKKRGKDTMQCFLTDRNGRVTCEAVGFRMFERWQKQNLPAGRQASAMDVVHQPTLLDYKGIVSIQLELEDWVVSET